MTTIGKFQIKDTKTKKIAKTAKSISDLVILIKYPLFWKLTKLIAITMKVKDTIIGARIGPVQGTGIRKSISQVKREDGQFRSNFSQI